MNPLHSKSGIFIIAAILIASLISNTSCQSEINTSDISSVTEFASKQIEETKPSSGENVSVDSENQSSTSTLTTTPTQVIEPLIMDFGLDSNDFPLSAGETVETILIALAERYKGEYPFHYVIYPPIGRAVVFNWSQAYRPSLVGATFLEQFRENVVLDGIIEPEIFEKIMGSGYYSYIVDGYYQTVVLITKETGEDGKERNGFFFLGGVDAGEFKGVGGVIYIEDGDIRTFRGDKIDIQDEEVLNLYKQGYTRVENINGVKKGYFPISEVTSSTEQ